MKIIVYIVNIALIAFVVYKLYWHNRHSPIARFFLPALVLKVLAGIGLGLIFKYHYQFGDTLTFFKEASRFADLAADDFGEYLKTLFGNSDFQTAFERQPRALFFAKITSVLAIITAKNYWLMSVYYSLFSFYCLWLFARRLVSIYENKAAILLSLFAFPSVVFWSSGVMKESLAIGLIALLLSSTIGYLYNEKKLHFWQVIVDLTLLFFLWKLKYYYAAVLVLVIASMIIALVLADKSRIFKSGWAQLAAIIICGVVGTYLVTFIHPNFNLDRVVGVIVENHNAFLDSSEPFEVIHFNNLTNTWKSILINSPKALFSGLFRPLPGDGHGWLSLGVKIENIMLLILCVSALWKFNTRLTAQERILIISVIFYCVFLAAFLALSAPNFGTLVRYKLGFLPVLLLLITVSNPMIKRLNQWVFKE